MLFEKPANEWGWQEYVTIIASLIAAAILFYFAYSYFAPMDERTVVTFSTAAHAAEQAAAARAAEKVKRR